jgi:hypothetical protein
MNTEPINIPFEGNAADFMAEAKKVQAGMDALKTKLEQAGVSQSAYNKAVSDSVKATQSAKKAEDERLATMQKHMASFAAVQKQKAEALAVQNKEKMSWTDLKSVIDLTGQALQKVKQGYDLAKQGAQIEFTAIKFDRLAQTIGTTGDALKDKLLDATKGTMSEMAAMASATDLVSLGLVKTEKDTVRLSAVVAGLGMDMNQLVLALSNQTTMRFDQLGVAVVGFDEKVKALEATGMSAQDAFTEAFLQQAEEQLKKVGNAADTSLGKFLRFDAATEDLKNSLKMLAATAATPLLPGVTDAVDDAVFRIEHFKEIWTEVYELLKAGKAGGVLSFFEMQEIQDLATANIKIQEYTDGLDSAGLSYRAMADSAGVATVAVATNASTAEASKEQLKAISDANGLFVGTLQNVGTNLEDYKSAQAAANAELAAGKITAEEYASKMDALAAKYEESKNRIILSIVEMKLASDGWTNAELQTYLKVGEGLGVFTEEMRQETLAVLTEADNLAAGYDAMGNTLGAAISTGADTANSALADMDDPLKHAGARALEAKVNFEMMGSGASGMGDVIRSDATPAVSELVGVTDALPPSGTKWDYEFNISVNGQVPNLPSDNNNNFGDPDDNLLGGRAAGGPLYKGWTLVGERGYELISPSGYVHPHEQSKKMLDGGFRPGKGLMFGGDIETPGQLIGGGGYETQGQQRRRRRDQGGSPITGASPEAESAAASMAADTADFITPALNQQANVMTNAVSAQITGANAMLKEQKKTNALLTELLGKTPGSRENLNNQTFINATMT